MSEVFQHDKDRNAWTVVNGRVYDISDFLHEHPGGFANIFRAVGKDGTAVFCKLFVEKHIIIYRGRTPFCRLVGIFKAISDWGSPKVTINSKLTLVHFV